LEIPKIELDKVTGRRVKLWESLKLDMVQGNPLEARGRSTQERLSTDKRDLPVHRDKIKGCQDRKWLPHQCDTFIEFGLCQPPEIDTGYAIMVFQCADDIVLIRVIVETCLDANGQDWPDIQCYLYVCSGFAYKLQIKMAGVCKDDTSPSSAYVYQHMPPPCAVIVYRYQSIGVKYP
jgi:hypothetical protein